MTEELIQRFSHNDNSALEDLLVTLAGNVEDALLMSGATPGTDYTRLDCFKLAMPFALSMFDKDHVHFAANWKERFNKT